MTIRNTQVDLRNLSSQVAMEAYARMSATEHMLQDTNPALWRDLYDASCRGVLRGEPRTTIPHQLSLPLERQA